LGNIVLVGTGRGVTALSGTTGATMWLSSNSVGEVEHVASDGSTVIGTNGGLQAYSVSCATPCSPLFLTSGGSWPVIQDESVFVPRGHLNAFDWYPLNCSQPCAPTWTRFTQESAANLAAIADDRVFNVGGSTLAVYPTTCEQSSCGSLWTAQGIGGPAVVSNGVVYVPGQDGHLKAFDDISGQPLLDIAPSVGRLVWPSVVDGAVYAIAGDWTTSSGQVRLEKYVLP
jgi:outer membrane protein assembly factor BamB